MYHFTLYYSILRCTISNCTTADCTLHNVVCLQCKRTVWPKFAGSAEKGKWGWKSVHGLFSELLWNGSFEPGWWLRNNTNYSIQNGLYLKSNCLESKACYTFWIIVIIRGSSNIRYHRTKFKFPLSQRGCFCYAASKVDINSRNGDIRVRSTKASFISNIKKKLTKKIFIYIYIFD